MTSQKISTPALRKLIMNAIETIAPLFDLSAEEVKFAGQFAIRRTLKHASNAYRDHDEQISSYAPLHHFFYFPVRDSYPGSYAIDSKNVILHETGHHLHNIVNPQIAEGVRTFLRTGKLPEGQSDLREIVAEYANLVLGFGNRGNSLYESACEHPIRVYSQYGPEFLPVLARMSLDEAIRRKVVMVTRPRT